MKVICTLAIVLSNGYHDVRELQGTVLKEGMSKKRSAEMLYVDFSDELKKGKFKLDKVFARVQWVPDNDCEYVKGTYIEYK